MDVKDKVIAALRDGLDVHYVRLEGDDGITGFVVSPRFQEMSSLDRQLLIENALENAKKPLSFRDRRQVLMIAGLTPEEYESVGAPIRIHKVKELGGGTFEILIHGGHSDAEYVRGALKSQKGVQTTDPEVPPGAAGILISFHVKSDKKIPLSKTRVIDILKTDKYIEVMTNA